MGMLDEFRSLNDPEISRVRDAAAQRVAALRERAAKDQERQAIVQRRAQGVSIGMTAERVLQSSWGRPNKVNRTITARGTHEQWVYGGGYLYFEDGVLISIQN
jgi:hypothetical protein